MRLPLATLALLAACADPAPPTGPPEGWVAASDSRWYVPGADTSTAFRDLTTIEAMGVARDESDFVRWVQERMTDVYRTNPEVVDSVFAAEFMDDVQAGVPADGDYGEGAEALVNQIKTDIYQRYTSTRYVPPDEPFAVPSDLQDSVGPIAVQVYVGADKEPVAVKLVEGTGTALDQMFMRRALASTYTDGWVRPRTGRLVGPISRC